MTPQSPRYSTFWIAILLLVGCAEEQIDRIAVSGTVTQKSGVVARGTISFVPTDGTEGPSATASIENGKYQFDKSNGPISGHYNVMIVQQVGKKIPSKAGLNPAAQKSIDPWAGKADVTADDNMWDFNLDNAISDKTP